MWQTAFHTCSPFLLPTGNVDTLTPINSSDKGCEEWVILDTIANTQLGNPTRRIRERILLAQYRATRAEQLAREALKKLQMVPRRHTSVSEIDAEVFSTITEEEENKPFWVIPKEEVQLTGEEVGRGRWAIVRVATYRGIRVAARCFFGQILSEDNRKVFIECMHIAAKVRHPNLLPFIGAILEEEPIIITELMPFNLKTVLEKSELPYHHIVGIASDIAKGLNFLHTMKPDPLVHGDLTNTNVLLEQARGAKWRAKLSDFMTVNFFQQLLPSSTSSDPVSPRTPPPPGMGKRTASRSSLGTIGRKISISAPEGYETTRITPKQDVYSYGVLLVELCTRTSPLDVSMAYLIESIRWQNMSMLIKSCIESDPDERPTMEKIIPKIIAFEAEIAIPPHSLHK